MTIENGCPHNPDGLECLIKKARSLLPDADIEFLKNGRRPNGNKPINTAIKTLTKIDYFDDNSKNRETFLMCEGCQLYEEDEQKAQSE